MGYDKTTWVNEVTKVNAKNMNHIENGIADCSNRIDDLDGNAFQEADIEYINDLLTLNFKNQDDEILKTLQAEIKLSDKLEVVRYDVATRMKVMDLPSVCLISTGYRGGNGKLQFFIRVYNSPAPFCFCLFWDENSYCYGQSFVAEEETLHDFILNHRENKKYYIQDVKIDNVSLDINHNTNSVNIPLADRIKYIPVNEQTIVEEAYEASQGYPFITDNERIVKISQGSGDPVLYTIYCWYKQGFGYIQNILGENSLDSLLSDSIDYSWYESSSNKVTSLSASSTDTEYPSAKATYDAIQNNKGTKLYLHKISFYMNVSGLSPIRHFRIATIISTKETSFVGSLIQEVLERVDQISWCPDSIVFCMAHENNINSRFFYSATSSEFALSTFDHTVSGGIYSLIGTLDDSENIIDSDVVTPL